MSDSLIEPNPEDYLTLRTHRARSVVLTSAELVEIRASQRTFEGAYLRTALGQFSFSLVILKIFTSEFYPIGALFAAYGAGIMVVALYRRYEGNRQFFGEMVMRDTQGVGAGGWEAASASSTSSGRAGGGDVDGMGETTGFQVGRKGVATGEMVATPEVLDLGSDGAILSTPNPWSPRASFRGGGAVEPATPSERQGTFRKRFRTSGDSVALLTVLSFGAYVTLLVLTCRLSNEG